MANYYEPPSDPTRKGTSSAPSTSFDGGSPAFKTVVISLAGASMAQVAGLVPMLVPGGSSVPESLHGLLWGWLAVSGIATCCGLLGGYRSLRSASLLNFPMLVFLALYSLTVRVENLTFGWPFQVHVGMVFGKVGFGLNLVGIGILCWWVAIRLRETSDAGPPEALEGAGPRPPL